MITIDSNLLLETGVNKLVFIDSLLKAKRLHNLALSGLKSIFEVGLGLLDSGVHPVSDTFLELTLLVDG